MAVFCAVCCPLQQNRHKTKRQQTAKGQPRGSGKPKATTTATLTRSTRGSETPRGRLDGRKDKKTKRLPYTEEKARAFSVVWTVFGLSPCPSRIQWVPNIKGKGEKGELEREKGKNRSPIKRLLVFLGLDAFQRIFG